MATTFQDPFALIDRIAASTDRPGELRDVAGTDLGKSGAEILRLIYAGDRFGAGIVLSMALGQPLVAPEALPRCRHCNKPVEDGGGEHEDCRINERELWGPSGRPNFRY